MANIKVIDTQIQGLSSDDDTVRTPPHNIEAEQALLGAILEDSRVLEDISDFLKPAHFYVPVHQRIYDATLKLVDRGQNADAVTVKAYFEKDEDLKDVGGADYVGDLSRAVISIINAKNYARIIHDCFMRRELIAVGRDVVNDAFEQDIDGSAEDCLEMAEKRLYDLAETGDNSGGFITMKDAVGVSIQMAEKAFKTDGNVTGVTTGLTDLDKRLGGLQQSDLLILAARPGMGKTSLAVNIAYNAANAFAKSGGAEGGRVGVISLEMSADQLASRLLCDLAEMPFDRLRRGDFNTEEFRGLAEAAGRLAQIPLYIDDTPAQTITAVRTRARRMKRKHGLELLIVDYLQLLRGTGSKQSENRVLEVSEITRGLKAIAKELQIPVIALSQLSRGVESREDKRPQLSDLRESGSIEQDADVVMFIYRQDYYTSKEEPVKRADENDAKYAERYEMWQSALADCSNIAEVIISKQRHGPTGTVKLFFEGKFTRFRDLDQHHDERL
jgi:replicative DNA helicase